MIMGKVMKNIHHMRGKPEPKGLGLCTFVGLKESSKYIVKDNYSKVVK